MCLPDAKYLFRRQPGVSLLSIPTIILALQFLPVIAEHLTAPLPLILISDVRTCPCTFHVTASLNSAPLDFIVQRVLGPASRYPVPDDAILQSFSRYGQAANDADHKDSLLAVYKIHIPLRLKVQLVVHKANKFWISRQEFLNILPDSRRVRVCPTLIPQQPAPDIFSSVFSTHIFGGRPANLKLAACLVLIFTPLNHLRTNYSICSGSVIDKQIVLTAAHCKTNNESFVYIGHNAVNMNSPPRGYGVRKFVAHPMYSSASEIEKVQYDIAYILLEKNVSEGTPILKVNQNKSSPASGSYVRAIGYGLIKESRHYNRPLHKLNQVDVIAQSHSICKTIYKNESTVVAPDKVLCAGRTDQDGCGVW